LGGEGQAGAFHFSLKQGKRQEKVTYTEDKFSAEAMMLQIYRIYTNHNISTYNIRGIKS
jgi:hypothetical protein